MKKNSFNLTYVEGLLLLTNGISASALHRQHYLLAEQSTIIANLSSDFNKLSKELLEIKTAKSLDTGLASTKIVDTGSSYFPDFLSYLDPKLLVGVALAGTVYYGIPYLSTKILLPSLKYLFIPIKSAAVALIPFLKETKCIEAIKDDYTYRVVLTGNQLSELEVRPVDSPNFESISDLVTQYFSRRNSTTSEVAVQTIDNIDKPSEALVPISSTGDISEISETLLQASTPVDPMTIADTTNIFLTALKTLS